MEYMYDIEDGKMVVNVIGLGYIGLPTALIFAASGIKVVATDIDEQKVENLKNGRFTFGENGLQEIYDKAVNTGIEFGIECKEADVYIIALPTPYNKRSRTINSKYVISGVESALKKCRNNSIVIVESTVSPGTIDNCVLPLVEKKNKTGDMHIAIAHAPERIIPGNMLYELVSNNRIIGAYDTSVAEKVKRLYEVFCKGNIILTDIRTAELTKVAENTYRDINIAYANELVKICREAKVDVHELIKIANMHPRVNILSPGPGVGGHCISVDPWFLVGDYPEIANLILTARRVNDSMPEYVLGRISEIMEKENITSLEQVGLYGLTYKENVDDIRESPSLQLISCMKKHAAKGVRTYDPFVKNQIIDGQYFDLNDFLSGLKMIVILVGHDEIVINQSLLHDIVVYDTRDVLSVEGKYGI